MHRSLVILGLAVVATLVPRSVSAASITFASGEVVQGQNLTVGVRILDVIDLFTFGFDLTFDPNVLQATSVTDGGFLATGLTVPGAGVTFTPGQISPGLISFTIGSIFGPPEQLGASGEGLLALFTFQALRPGASNLAFANGFFLDSTLPDGLDIAVNALPGTINVVAPPQPVPEPSTLGLLGIGLAAMAWRMRRRTPVTASVERSAQ